MKLEEIKKQAENMWWWHSIDLPTDDGRIYTTKGNSGHTSVKIAETYFGIPKSLEGKTVLDVGAWDGYFSFLAESKGAIVKAIDPLQGWHKQIGTQGFDFAKKLLKSNVQYEISTIEEVSEKKEVFDVVFLFGTLYHTPDPIKQLKALFNTTKEYALIETAIAYYKVDNGTWEYKPGLNNDETNFWFPSVKGLQSTLLHVGFKKAEVISQNEHRASFRAVK